MRQAAARGEKKIMFGAVLGDIVGSPYEKSADNIKTKDFPLFSERSRFTDDSVMTLAVAHAFLETGYSTEELSIREELISSMQAFGRRHPFAGYGARFSQWLRSPRPRPYNSFGNGSAMRVSSVGWLFHDLAKVRQMARLSAEVTHNHPEGIKGAEAVASAIFLARTGSSKDQIRAHIESKYRYDLSRTTDEIRPAYALRRAADDVDPVFARRHTAGDTDSIFALRRMADDTDSVNALRPRGDDNCTASAHKRTGDDAGSVYENTLTCMGSVPEAITAFLCGENFEDVLREAVSLGGDSDTIAAIAGSIAEAFYGIPDNLKAKCYDYLTDDLAAVLRTFEEAVGC